MDWLLVSVQTIKLLLSGENTLPPQLFHFLQSVRWSWSAATCLLPCLRVFLCSEQTIQLIHLSVSLFAICEILEATCLNWCLLNFQLQSQDSTSPLFLLIQVAILPSSHPSGNPGISSSSPHPSGYPSILHLLLIFSSSLSVEVQVEIRIQCQLYHHLMPSNPIWIELNLPKCPHCRGFDFSALRFRDFLFGGD